MKTLFFSFRLYSLQSLVVIILFGLTCTSAFFRERCISCVMYPILTIEARIVAPFRQWWEWRRGEQELRSLAQKTLEERNNLLRELIQLKEIESYFQESGECRKFHARYLPQSAVAVQILLQHYGTDAHYLFIDAGENQNIQKDMVVVYDTFLVGRVQEVYPHYSKVMLITDKECHVSVRCSETGAQGIHTGVNACEQCAIDFVSHLEKVDVGDIFSTQGEGLIFPRGFGVGRVVSCQTEGVQYRIQVEPLIDFKKLTFCSVLVNY